MPGGEYPFCVLKRVFTVSFFPNLCQEVASLQQISREKASADTFGFKWRCHEQLQTALLQQKESFRNQSGVAKEQDLFYLPIS